MKDTPSRTASASGPHLTFAGQESEAAKKLHEPEPKADADPTAGLPATAMGRELGADGEARIAEDDRRQAQDHDPEASSSNNARGSRMAEPGGTQGAGEGQPTDTGAAPRERAARGPDQGERVRRSLRDQGTGPESPHDWSYFDIGRVVRLFRTNREGAIRLTLRKLHVRWWHASEHTMRRFLERVGVSQRVLDLIPSAVQTCTVCRAWAKPGPSSSCNVIAMWNYLTSSTSKWSVTCYSIRSISSSTCYVVALVGMQQYRSQTR